MTAIGVVAAVFAGGSSPIANAAVVHHVAGTGTDGLYLHSSPGVASTTRVGLMPEGNEFDVICWTISDNVLGDSVWLQGVWRGVTGFASDYYIDTHWTTTQDLTNQGMPPCGGGGGGGGGESDPPPVTTSAQWQLTGPQLSYNLQMGSPYVIAFAVKNVGNAAGSFTVTDSDPACTSSRSASLAPGASSQLRFVCVQKWDWIQPWGASAWALAFHQVTGGVDTALQVKDFLAHAADIITKARAALDSIHLPKLVSNGILGLDDAANVLDTVGNGFTFIEDRRDVLLITQNKNWRPTFTSNFGYSPTLPGAPAQLAVPVSVPSYKWDAYTSFTRTEISAIAFDIGALVTGKVEAKQKNPLVKAALFAASQTMGFLAGRGHDAAKAMYIAAYDPATDYQTPPTVSYTSTDRLDSLPNGPMKDWAVAYSHALDVEAARDQAIVRYAGAVSAGDDGAQAVQLGALQDLTAQEQSLLASNPQGEQDLLATLPADLTTADQQEVLSALADPNFASSDIGQIMVAAGADPGEVAGLAQDAAQVMTPGDSVDLRAAVADGLSQQSGLLQDSAADTSLLLADTDAAMGKPAAVVELDQAAGEDGMFHGTVTATISSDSSYPAADHFEYALDGGAFARYTGAVPVFGAGHHVLIARAVAADGTVQDPPTTTSIDIAQPHSPPIAEIGEPNVIVAADHGLPVTVTLDGSRSHDQNGDSLSYSWSFDDPSGTTADTTGAAVTHTFSRYGGYTARLSVNNGYYTTAATANIEIVDVTAPTLTAPNDLTIRTGADAADKITAWLASATATDDGGGAVTITNDYTETGAAGTRTTVTWTATDSSGNSAKASATLTLLDGTPPVITPVLAGTTGDGGWYTSDVNLNWQVADPESPITATSGCEASIVSVDTNGTTFTCTATSTGGTSTQTVTVRRDTTPPEIKPSRTPAPNAAGWNKTNVTAVFDCTDAGSDIATCPAPVVFHEGANQNATVTATDKAANKASYTVTDVNVDTTPPLLHGTATTAPNDHGWYSGDVTIHWTCDDTGSGIAGACPADATIGGEGASLASTATVRDIAGNTTAATSSNVRIDRAPPVTEASAPSGWSNTGVTVMLTPSDNLAGVDATYFQLDDGPTQAGTSVSITDEGVHAVAYWSVDLAGNVERQRKIQVRIDKTAPTITHAASPAANDAGWNRTDVTVTFSCADALSGIAFCTPAQLLTTDGQALPITGKAVDNAGNSAQETLRVSIDKTPPTITATPDRPANADGWYNANVLVSFTCADSLSGIVNCPAPVVVSEGRDQTVTRVATDAARNTASGTAAGLNVDVTPPTVAYAGNTGTYTVDQTISITCGATDALSGVASTTCAAIKGPAWSFGLGSASRSATATDRAGNLATGATTFTVGVTCTSLKTLVGRFATNAGVAAALSAKLDAICTAPNANAKSGKLGAFDNELAAQTGKTLTADQATLLGQFAAAL